MSIYSSHVGNIRNAILGLHNHIRSLVDLPVKARSNLQNFFADLFLYANSTRLFIKADDPFNLFALKRLGVSFSIMYTAGLKVKWLNISTEELGETLAKLNTTELIENVLNNGESKQ